MEFNNFQINQKYQTANNECMLRGICTPSPVVTYLQEVVRSYLGELAFYLIKLRTFGINNEKIRENVLEVLSSLIIGVNYDEAQFSYIATNIYNDLTQAKELYQSVCNLKNVKLEHPRVVLKKPPKKNISDMIRQGQKLATKKVQKFTVEEKNLYDLAFDVAKSVCIHLIELQDLEIFDEDAYFTLLELINMVNLPPSVAKKMGETLENIVELDHSLMMKIHETKIKRYGDILSTEVSVSCHQNRAILVSGSNLRDLELLLDATKNRGVDIYTHGQLIIAHAFPKFKKYPHLVGHYGTGMENYFVDFSSFPGAIFMTKHSMHKVENLYRSRIFTTDTVAPRGVVLIKQYNFEPLIESALSAKGFRHSEERGFVKLALDEKKLLQKLSKVASEIEKGTIKNIFMIGVSNNTKTQKEYFEKFIKLLNKDCFAISFSYKSGGENFLSIESEYGSPILYEMLEILTKNLTIEELNPIVLFTRCDIHSLSNVIYMHKIGVKKIYFTDCPTNLINPALVQAVVDLFGVKKYTTPKEDFDEMISK